MNTVRRRDYQEKGNAASQEKGMQGSGKIPILGFSYHSTIMDTLLVTFVSAVSSQRKEWNLRYHESHIEVQIKGRPA